MLKIKRTYHNDCTTGFITCGNFRAMTLELPDKDNQPNISCIPEGRYKCVKITSPSLGYCIEIQGILNRTHVRIHKGNYTRQIQGCVLVGTGLADINKDGIVDITNSKVAFDELMRVTPNEFELIIE